MKRWLAIVLCLAFLPSAAAFAQKADDPATKEDVQKLFDIQNSRKLFDSVMAALKQQIPAMTKSTMAQQLPNASPEDMARMDAFTNDLLDKIFQTMPYDELMQAMMPAYQHHLTHGEIQQLITFYSSPVGKKFLTEMPAIMSEYMQAATPVIQKWQAAQMAGVQSSAEDYAKTLRAKKAAPGSPAAAPVDAVPASLLQPLYPH